MCFFFGSLGFLLSAVGLSLEISLSKKKIEGKTAYQSSLAKTLQKLEFCAFGTTFFFYMLYLFFAN